MAIKHLMKPDKKEILQATTVFLAMLMDTKRVEIEDDSIRIVIYKVKEDTEKKHEHVRVDIYKSLE